MKNNEVVGIDLGTSTCAAARIVSGRPSPILDPMTKSPLVPSIIGLNIRGELIAGAAAAEEVNPAAILRETKRRMGDDYQFSLGEYKLSPSEAGAVMLRQIADNVELGTGTRPSKVVVTVPAYFSDIQRRATTDAVHLAGLSLIRLISEPVAAAMAYGIDKLEDEAKLLVFDFGGGTLDVSICELFGGVLEVKATDGDDKLGGKDIDTAIITYLIEANGYPSLNESSVDFEKVKRVVENAKKRLSSEESVRVFAAQVASPSGVADWDASLTRSQLEQIVEPIISKAIATIDRALGKAGIRIGDLDRLLLVGGTCYMPLIKKRVQAYIGLKAEQDLDPDLAVSFGAAISAGLASGAISRKHSVLTQDAATYRMGTGVLEQVGSHYMLGFSELMPANAPIPFSRTQRYHLLTLEQDSVDIEVYQDPSGKAQLAHDAVPTGAVGVIKDIPPSTTQEPRVVDVTFTYDENHIIQVNAKVVGLNRECTVQLNKDSVSPNPLEVRLRDSDLETLWENSPISARNTPIIKKAQELVDAAGDGLPTLDAALAKLKLAVASNDKEAAADARRIVTDIIAGL